MSRALVSSASRSQGEGWALARDYLSLLKLRVVVLLVITALGAMPVAAGGMPKLLAVFGVMVGGTLAAGGAEAINAWFDRDIDAVMSRTRRRPVPSGRIPAWHALALGLALNGVAFLALDMTSNALAATLALAGSAIYVLVYTMWLKRLTPQNIVIGGASGAMPPLVGWAAATGRLDLTAVFLFLVVFFWTPPHFWALAQMMKNDYAEAHVPMLPVVQGDLGARRLSAAYALLTALASVVPFFTGREGPIYLVGALVLGAAFVGLCLANVTSGALTRRVWFASLLYLAALFGLLALGAFWR